MSIARHIRAAARRAFGRATRVVAATALLAGVAVSSAHAAATPHATPGSLAPMRFMRVMGHGACEPNCPEWISAEGKIVTGSADALGRVADALDGRRLPIFINSAGGSVEDAMAMGRIIRAKRLAVVVAHTAIEPCPASVVSCGEARGAAELVGAYCASACTLVLAGGVERYVSPLSFVGVHQLVEVVHKTTVKRSYKVKYFTIAWFKWELSRKLVGVKRSTATVKRAADRSIDDEVADYFAEMGVGEEVMALTVLTPSRRVRWLTADELATTHMATIRVDGASPIAEGEGPSGLAGEPIDARSGAASLFVAKSDSLPPGAPAELAGDFSYRRGGGAVLASFQAPGPAMEAPPGATPSALLLTLYPNGAQFPVDGPAAGRRARVSIPVRDFCALARGGRAVVSRVKRQDDTVATPVTLDLPVAHAKLLFDEACARLASAASIP